MHAGHAWNMCCLVNMSQVACFLSMLTIQIKGSLVSKTLNQQCLCLDRYNMQEMPNDIVSSAGTLPCTLDAQDDAATCSRLPAHRYIYLLAAALYEIESSR